MLYLISQNGGSQFEGNISYTLKTTVHHIKT